jgi:hypothetical protein
MSKEEGRRWAERILKIDPNAKARFGKMTVAQMVVHCRLQFESTWGGPQHKPVGLMGRTIMKFMVLFGPWPKGKTPTIPPWDMSRNGVGTGSFGEDVKALAAAAERFFQGGYARKASPVVGPLTEEQWLKLQRRHLEHHLSQFGA